MINVQNLSSSLKTTKSNIQIGKAIKPPKKGSSTSRKPRVKKDDTLVSAMVYWDNGYFIYYGSKERYKHYLVVDKDLYSEVEYNYATPSNDYWKLRPFYCHLNKASFEKYERSQPHWSIFVAGMKIKGRWVNNVFKPDSDSINEYSRKYYKENKALFEEMRKTLSNAKL